MTQVIYETGATSHAVNDLILYTDNTKELVEYRDNIYAKILKEGKSPTWEDFIPLLWEAVESNRKEFKNDFASYRHIVKMDRNERQEFCELYAKDFEAWKLEHIEYIKKLAEAEVREYTDMPIVYRSDPFQSNHLYCVRGKYCDFAEHNKYVDVYIKL